MSKIDLDLKMKDYVYKMIETLLPKALYTDDPQYSFKMMEMYLFLND